MRLITNIFGTLVALAILLTLGIGGYFVAKRYIVLFTRLNFTVAMVTGTAALVVVVAAVIIAGSIRSAAQKNSEVERRAGKAEAYKLFIRLWEEMFRSGQSVEAAAQLSRQMQDVTLLLLLHGCGALVKAHAALQSLNLTEARDQFAAALLAIRRDLGLESRSLEGRELLQLVVGGLDNPHSSSRQRAVEDATPRVSLNPN